MRWWCFLRLYATDTRSVGFVAGVGPRSRTLGYLGGCLSQFIHFDCSVSPGAIVEPDARSIRAMRAVPRAMYAFCPVVQFTPVKGLSTLQGAISRAH